SAAFLFVTFRLIEVRQQAQLKIAELAQQVAHDIRSPVTALRIALDGCVGVEPERRQLIEQATSRINSIAEDLLFQSRSKKDQNLVGQSKIENKGSSASYDLVSCIQEIVTEKNATLRDYQIEFSSDPAAVETLVNRVELQRITANVIQNALEAVASARAIDIQVAIRGYANHVEIIVIDNGVGMSEEVKSNLGVRGFTFAKDSGNGLGLNAAIAKVQSWGGTVRVDSKLGEGTMITLRLPRADD
ncbi:MAG: HAMP domain-containing histidine kinase, partial [Proteobacteria bacterium]